MLTYTGRHSQYPCGVNADEETDGKARHELAVRTSVAVLVGAAGMLGPDAGAAATALTPALETLLSRVVGSLSQWRFLHAAETLEYGANAAGKLARKVRGEGGRRRASRGTARPYAYDRPGHGVA